MKNRAKKGIFDTRLFPNIQEQFQQYGIDNTVLNYKYYVDMLLNICVSLFKWKNLPPKMDPFILEKTLLLEGRCVGFYDDVIGEKLVLPVMSSSNNNIFNEPKRRRAYSWNTGYSKSLDETNSVMFYNNIMRTSELADIYETAKKLYAINMARTTNINAQKTPILVICNEKNALTMENLYMQYDGNKPVIFSYDDFNPNEKFDVFKTDAPFVADKLFAAEQNELNSFLARKGVCSLSETKRERVITSEINALNGGAYAMRLSRLNARQRAVEEFNKMFDTEISVEFNDFLSFGDVSRETMAGGEEYWDTLCGFNTLLKCLTATQNMRDFYRSTKKLKMRVLKYSILKLISTTPTTCCRWKLKSLGITTCGTYAVKRLDYGNYI